MDEIEVVFIGMNISQKEISEALDQCLLRDYELDRYRREARNLEQMILNARKNGMDGVDLDDPIFK
jgi:hypothetical protein